MRNQLDSLPFRISGHTFTPAETGTAKLHRCVFPMRYVGASIDRLVDFLATVAGQPVRAAFSIGEGHERPKRKARRAGDDVAVVGTISKSARLAALGEGRTSVSMSFVVVSDDTRGMRELSDFAIEAARVEAVDVMVSFELVQASLPMGEDDGAAA